ncbi:MAG TPA: alpha/beta fold hydrolase, partial [Gemmataceae bacterium]
HAGPNRIYATAARQLAELGFSSLRFDFSGIGNSPARADHLPFEKCADSEVREATRWLGHERSTDRFVLVGLCSGATVALQAACDDPSIAGIVLLNFRGIGEQATSFVKRNAGANYSLRVSLFNWSSWGKLLTGRANYRHVLKSMAFWVGDRCIRRGRRTPEAEIDRQRLVTLLKRGTHVLVVYSAGDSGWDYYRMTCGDWNEAPAGSLGAFDLEIIPQADHTFTRAENQRRLHGRIVEWAARFRNTKVDASSLRATSKER